MMRRGRSSGVGVQIDGFRVRLQVWGKHFDELIVLEIEEAKSLAAELITAVAEISRSGTGDFDA